MLEEYISSLEKQDKSSKTIISYRNDILIFLDDLHIKPNEFVTAIDVRKWINSMLHPKDGKPLAITIINRRLNALHSFYSWARITPIFRIGNVICSFSSTIAKMLVNHT